MKRLALCVIALGWCVGCTEEPPARPPQSAVSKAKETVNLMLVKHGLELYKAMNGEYPKNQAVFDEQIIKANQIELPKLPDGDRYAYDPQKGEFRVEHNN